MILEKDTLDLYLQDKWQVLLNWVNGTATQDFRWTMETLKLFKTTCAPN